MKRFHSPWVAPPPILVVSRIQVMENPNGQQQQQQQQKEEKQKEKNQEKAMQKLREAILELSNSEPNVPLSLTQNSILQQRLKQFLSCLHTVPDHPPYAWMIEKALQELNEEGGSRDDSISEFIKKEYESLPWAHTTLLKHHLQKMSEKGEILMIDGGRYLLPRDSESLNSTRKKKRKYIKRKKTGNLEIKQKKPRQKGKKGEKRVQHDDAEVLREQKKLGEQESRIREESHNEPSTDKEDGQLSGQPDYISGKRVFHGRVQRSRLHKQKRKQQLDATEGSLQSSIAIGNDIGCNAGSVPIEPREFMMTEEIEHLEDAELQQPKLSLKRVEETADISNLCSQEILENEPGDNLPQILSPEAPPGYEFMVVEDATANKSHGSLSVGLDSPKEDRVVHHSSETPAEDQAPRTDDLSDALKQSKQIPKQRRRLQHVDGRRIGDESMPSETVLSLNQNLQQSLDTERSEEEFVAEDLLKTKKQQKKHHGRQQTNRATRTLTRAQKKGTVAPDAPMELAFQCQQQEQPRDSSQVQLPMESSSEPKQPSIPRKLTRTQLKMITSQPAASTDLSALKHLEQENSPEAKELEGKPYSLSKKIGGAQQQEQNISARDRRQVQFAPQSSSESDQLSIQRKRTRTQRPEPSTNLFALKRLEQKNTPETKQQVDEPCGLSKMTGAFPNEMIIPDIHGNLEVQQLTELSKMEGSHQIVFATAEPSSEMKQQLEEWRSTMEEKLNENSPETNQQVDDLYGLSTGALPIEMIIPDIHGNVDKREVQQLTRTKRSLEIVLPTVTSCVKKQQQLEEGLSTPGKLNADDTPDFWLLQSPTGSEAVSVEKSQTDRTQRQLKRWRKSPGESKSASNSDVEQLPLCASREEVEQPKQQRRGRSLRGKEDDEADLDNILVKDLGSSEKLMKNPRGRGGIRK